MEFDDIESMPEGDLRVAACEESVREADHRRDLEAMFRTRLELISACAYGGHGEKSFPAISWCLAQYQQDPERYQPWAYTLLWRYKQLLQEASTFPQISTAQFEQICDQAAELYRSQGYNLRPIHYIRFAFYSDGGNCEKARELFPVWQNIPRDSMADCRACEMESCVEYYGLVGEFERMVLAAQPSLNGGQSCTDIPHRTFADILYPLAKLGRYDEADGYQRKGLRLIRGQLDFVRHLGLHLAYLVHRQELRRAIAMFEQHLGFALRSLEVRNKCYFFAAAAVLLQALARTRARRKLRLPPTFALHDPSDTYEVASLLQWFTEQGGELARQLDGRNGNDFHTRAVPRLMGYN